MALERSLERWDNSDARAMAQNQSENAIYFAFCDAKTDIAALGRLARRVAALNRDAGEIGAGMLASLVDEARELVK